jgi:synaptojanin
MMGFTEISNDAYIFDVLKHMWAENGDVISKQYAGTGSTITSVTKTGKQGFFGKIDQLARGVERFIVNNRDDGLKHECIKLFLNQHPQQQPYGIKASLE